MTDAPLQTFEDWKLVFLTPWDTPALVLVVAAVLAALLLSARGYRAHRAPVRWLLVIMRAVALAAVLISVLQPALQYRSVTRIPNHVAVLVDSSRSMTIRGDGASRLQRARSVLQRSTGRLQRWATTRVIEPFTFGSQLHPLAKIDEPYQADDRSTRIRRALVDLRKRFRGDDLAGVVLLSDGNDNGRFGHRLSQPSLKFLEHFGSPVHSVWIGAERVRDLALTEVYADDFAFVRNAVEVEAELVVQGIQAEEIPVTLAQGERVVDEQRLKLQRGQSRYRVSFAFVPQQVGKYVYTVSAPVFEGEALADNNSRSFLIKVIRDRIRVLQLAGRPSWDERFLRRLLKRDPNVDLISFFILRTPSSLSLVPPSELSLIPFPTEELFEKQLGSFDLVILQNFAYGPYGIGVYLPRLQRFVEEGGGMVMLGGDLAFSSGGYAGTALASVLPLRLLPGSLPPEQLISVEDFRPLLTARGRDHPLMQIGASAAATATLWKGLPPLAGTNRVAGPAAGATVLAEHPKLRAEGGRRMPVLAVSESGKGRVMALTSDSSWHWAFKTVGAEGERRGYDRFWHNAIRWLIRDPELRYLRIIVSRGTVRLGGRIKAVIRAYRPDYAPAAGVKVAYEIASPAGAKGEAAEAVTDETGALAITYRPDRVGAHRIKVRALIGDRETEEEELVLVEPAGPEGRDPRAIATVLRQISKATGGQYLGEAAELPDLAFRPPRVLRVNWQRDVELWNRWWWLLGAVALLALEWTLRRRFGFL